MNHRIRTAALLLTCVIMAGALPWIANGGQTRKKRPKYGIVAGPVAQVSHCVDQFERAYQKKDKKTMIFVLMLPTKDAGTLEKRYQWYRGYGPTDMPGTVHPPILFETTKGSFVPTAYALQSTTKETPTQWHAVVQEWGTYHDEDGAYKVKRVRQIKLVKDGARWYIADYYIQENPEDYGFYVDDIIDKMTKNGS